MKTFLAGACVLALLLTAVPVALPAAGAPTLLDDVRAKMAELSGGSMQGSGRMYLWQPDGSAVVRPITTDDFLGITAYLSDELVRGVSVQAADPTAGGAGFGTVVSQAPFPPFPPAQLWPFCDAATAYVYYAGSPPAGAAFQQRTGTGQASPLGPVCPGLGAPFGTAYLWQDVTIDSRLLPAGATVVRQVGVAQVMLPRVDVPVGPLGALGVGGYLVGHPVASAHGSGSAVSMVWTSAFGSLSADMFRGNGGAVLVGNDELPVG